MQIVITSGIMSSVEALYTPRRRSTGRHVLNYVGSKRTQSYIHGVQLTRKTPKVWATVNVLVSYIM